MIDVKGITLAEINHKYPQATQILGYDTLLDVDSFHKPKMISTFEMCVNTILTLLMMKPGQYPSIPDLGIYVEQYLFEYADDESIPSKITNEIYDQCNRLQLAGVEVRCYFNKLNPSRPELVVEIHGTEYVTYNNDASTAIFGISLDKLNRLHMNKYQTIT